MPVREDHALAASLLTLSDVMGTGHHAAVVAKVSRGKKAAVVGDGAVGLCGVIAAKRLGAEQIIILGRHPARIALAKAFGATDVVSERGEEAVEHVSKLTGGFADRSWRRSSRVWKHCYQVVCRKSPLGKAAKYALAEWEPLTRYLSEGRLEVDNNLTENAIRPSAVGKKNWLFFGQACVVPVL